MMDFSINSHNEFAFSTHQIHRVHFRIAINQLGNAIVSILTLGDTMIDERFLSKKVQQVKPSGIRKFFDLASELEDVISLGVGEPNGVLNSCIFLFLIPKVLDWQYRKSCPVQ